MVINLVLPYFPDPGCYENGISYPLAAFGPIKAWQETANSTVYSCKGYCLTNKLCVAGTYTYNRVAMTWDCQMLSRTGWYFGDDRHEGITVLRDCGKYL